MSSINNFRPISVIWNIAKIFEKIIKTRLIFYLESNNILFKNQFGFRPNKSIDQAIARVTKFIYTALEENKKCATIYLDLAKAFDTVKHDKLLYEMQEIGITSNALSLFDSYLKNRKQLVKIKVASKNRTILILTLKRSIDKNRTAYRSLYNKLPHIYSGLKPHTIFSGNSENIRL